MVSTSSKKIAKYTYAERVLGAFSQAQKEHKRHAIHLATLRAQVKKTAQARKDRLGPQWSNWVKKAVHKLEDEGIFEPAEQSGSIALTPNGKNAINAARHNLKSFGTDSSNIKDDMVWKNIARKSIGQGLKRKQGTLGENEEEEENDQVEEEEEEVLSALKRKKARVAPRKSTGKKSISKMTKFELKTELKSLQRAHTAALNELEHSSTVPESELTTRLQEELNQRREEIEAVRNELAALRRVSAADETTIHDEDDTLLSIRPPTPSPIFEPLPSSTPRRGEVSPASRPLLGSTRTQSGSLIPHLSKQPTPAPSSPGSADGGLTTFEGFTEGTPAGAVTAEGHSGHASDALQPPVEDEPTVESAPPEEAADFNGEMADQTLEDFLPSVEHGFAGRDADILQAEFDHSEHTAPEDVPFVAAGPSVPAEPSDEIKALVQERDSLLLALLEEKENYSSEMSIIKGTISELDATVEQYVAADEAAKACISDLETTLSETRSKLTTAEAEKASLNEQRTLLEDVLKKAQDSAQFIQDQVDSSRRAHENTQTERKALDGRVHDACANLRQQVDTSNSACEALLFKVASVEPSSAAQTSADEDQGEALFRDVQDLAVTSDPVVQSSFLHLRQAISVAHRVQQNLDRVGKRFDMLTSLLTQKTGLVQTELHELKLKLKDTEQALSASKADLEEARAKQREMGEETTQNQARIDELSRELAATQDAASAKHAELSHTIESLRGSLSLAETFAATLQSELVETVQANEETKSELSSVQTELLAAQTKLHSEQDLSNRLEVEVERALDLVQDAEAAKHNAEATIEQLTVTFENLTKIQMANLTEFAHQVKASVSTKRTTASTLSVPTLPSA